MYVFAVNALSQCILNDHLIYNHTYKYLGNAAWGAIFQMYCVLMAHEGGSSVTTILTETPPLMFFG